MADFYRAEKLNDRMTAVISLTGEIMYLISGEKKSVLIDTCVGAGNLRAFVKNLPISHLPYCLHMVISIMPWVHRNLQMAVRFI